MKWKNIAVYAIIIIAGVYLFAQVSDLKSSLVQLESSTSNDFVRLENKISSVYSNVDAKLKEQASLFSKVSHDFFEFSETENLVFMNVSLIPKTLTDGMTVKISYDGRSAEFEKAENNEYKAVIPVELFSKGDEAPLVEIRTGNETKTQYLDSIDLKNLCMRYLPSIYADAVTDVNTTKYKDGKMNLRLILDIGYNASSYDKKILFKKIDVVTEINGEEVDRKDYTKELLGWGDITSPLVDYEYPDGQSAEIIFEKSYPMKETDELSVDVEAVDILGYIHRYRGYFWKQNKDGAVAETAFFGNEIIMDKDRNILYDGK